MQVEEASHDVEFLWDNAKFFLQLSSDFAEAR
jgi:hypothetical protein